MKKLKRKSTAERTAKLGGDVADVDCIQFDRLITALDSHAIQAASETLGGSRKVFPELMGNKDWSAELQAENRGQIHKQLTKKTERTPVRMMCTTLAHQRKRKTSS